MSVHVETRVEKSVKSFTATFAGISGYPTTQGLSTPSPEVDLDSDGVWCVHIYPGGIGVESFLACQLQYLSDRPCRAFYKLSILNQKGWKHKTYSSGAVKTFNRSDKLGDASFMKQAELTNEATGFCVDDTIVVKVDLVIFSEIEHVVKTGTYCHSSGIAMTPLSSPARHGVSRSNSLVGAAGATLADDLQQAMTDESTADVTLRVLDASSGELIASFPAHKFMLSLRSVVFRAMFCSTMSESISGVVDISDLQASVVRAMLQYVYTDHVGFGGDSSSSSSSSNACSTSVLNDVGEELLAAACKYQIPGLEALCEHHLMSTLNNDNAVSVMCLAHSYGAKNLKARALQYIARNAKVIMHKEGFFESMDFALCQEVMLQMAGLSHSGAAAAALVEMSSSESLL